ncbi:MAG TPA: hypothetical protein VGI19_19645 [Candidatus Cybelea sp.]
MHDDGVLVQRSALATIEQVGLAAPVRPQFDKLLNSSEGKLVLNAARTSRNGGDEKPAYERVLAQHAGFVQVPEQMLSSSVKGSAVPILQCHFEDEGSARHSLFILGAIRPLARNTQDAVSSFLTNTAGF